MKLRWAAAILVLALSALMPSQLSGQQTAPTVRKSSANPLGQNYPNPFNPETTIPFAVGDSASCANTPSRQYRVSLRIYNVLAQLVAIPILQAGTGSATQTAGSAVPLVDTRLTCGRYTAFWDGKYLNSSREVASGMYLARLEIDGKPFVRKMIVTK
jgi:hypothetical protein